MPSWQPWQSGETVNILSDKRMSLHKARLLLSEMLSIYLHKWIAWWLFWRRASLVLQKPFASMVWCEAAFDIWEQNQADKKRMLNKWCWYDRAKHDRGTVRPGACRTCKRWMHLFDLCGCLEICLTPPWLWVEIMFFLLHLAAAAMLFLALICPCFTKSAASRLYHVGSWSYDGKATFFQKPLPGLWLLGLIKSYNSL